MANSLFTSHVGIGLKPQHFDDVLALADSVRQGAPPQLGWVEIHPQNYVRDGGPMRHALAAISEEFPVSFHSVALSIGGADGPIQTELDTLAALTQWVVPARISDHLSWSGNAHDALPDLLPLPYTREALHHFARGVEQVQQKLGCQLLIENPSRMLAFADDEMAGPDFLNRLVASTGCGLLLDVNNVLVSATNLNSSAKEWLDAIDHSAIGEVHLAGHAIEWHEDGPLAIDDHGSPVSASCWMHYADLIGRTGPLPTLIEWDTDVPSFATLLAEAAEATAIIAAACSEQEIAA